MGKRMVYAEDVLELIDRGKAYMTDVGRIHAKNAVNEAPTRTICNLCKYFPPSSLDGKPCTMCVAEEAE